ncbi:fimbrial protein, partial [Salmonella enterica]|nr:long polar fimbrial protein LpfA [Salmonella enterica subsp. enterica serovar Benin]EBW4219718.1 long polar fimbrial protein LpfA [Salmonella enterica subsp. enterica serovar Benin]ECE9228789.1 long polar fimbrial protein LpfA [Salmonella enterica subsp. enterica serovar Benin]ECZ8128524.1 fimbrial protein [Salmonella enterica]EEG5325367.1 fimbrial protein [Salmonella enterica]
TSAFAAATDDSGGGTINFTGSVINAPCSVSTDSQNINVLLGQVSNSRLSGAGTYSDPKKITISLIDCSFAAASEKPDPGTTGNYSKVAVTFTGFSPANSQALTKGEIPNAAPNGAKNVVIQLLKSDGTAVNLSETPTIDNAIPLITSSKNNDLIFYARMAATDTVTTGDVSAQITYKLKYF